MTETMIEIKDEKIATLIDAIKESEIGVITASNMLDAVFVGSIEEWVKDCKTEDQDGNPLIVFGQELFWLLNCNSKKINEEIIHCLWKEGFSKVVLNRDIFDEKKLFDFILDVPAVVVFDVNKQEFKVIRASDDEANDGFWFFRDTRLIYKSQQGANAVTRIAHDTDILTRELECYLRLINVFEMLEIPFPIDVQFSIKHVLENLSDVIWGGYSKNLKKLIA